MGLTGRAALRPRPALGVTPLRSPGARLRAAATVLHTSPCPARSPYLPTGQHVSRSPHLLPLGTRDSCAAPDSPPGAEPPVAPRTRRYVLRVPLCMIMILSTPAAVSSASIDGTQLGQTVEHLHGQRDREWSRCAGTKDHSRARRGGTEAAQAAYLQDAARSSDSLCDRLRLESPPLWFTVAISGQ